MESARNTLSEEPLNGVTAGLDWARDDHAVAVVDGRGVECERWTVPNTGPQLRRLVERLQKLGVAEVAIERGDGPVVAALLEAGLTVVVISPNQLRNLRGRYGSAGNKDDRFDAFVLADTLRTDRARLRPLTPDSPATITLRQTCRARKDLVEHRVAVANQLRAHLLINFPGAVGLFNRIDAPISLRFLTPVRLPRPRRLAHPDPAGRLAPLDRLLRPHQPRRPAHPANHRTPRHHRPRQHRQPPHHPRPGRRPDLSQHPDHHPERPDRHPTRPPHRRAHLHQPAPLRHHPRRPPTQRTRRLPRPLPHPTSPDLPGRRRSHHPPIRHPTHRPLPLRRRQTTPRRHLRLRRRLPQNQPLGRQPLPPSPQPRTHPPPRRPHPRPRLAPHHLALLATTHPLPTHPPPRTPTPTHTPNQPPTLTQDTCSRTQPRATKSEPPGSSRQFTLRRFFSCVLRLLARSRQEPWRAAPRPVGCWPRSAAPPGSR
ncbi:transposase [Kribbella amoyensis]|uniref:Transposase n=1 Tax=Kribbella amoyensis TaxID=996641 RepID=A0A561BWJ7_9ACTN|nr:transposase [Kribbella amoyensis]